MARKRSSRRRHRGRNPSASLRRPLGAITAGFNKNTLMDAGIVAGGMFAQHALRAVVIGRVPVPGSGLIKSILNGALGVGTAGLMLFVPKVGPKLFAGAMAYEAGLLIKEVLPASWTQGLSGDDDDGMGDYMTTGNDPALGDYMTQGQDQQLADYADTQELTAAALDASSMAMNA